MEIPTDQIKELRAQCGAGIMECRNSLLEAKGNMEKALKILKEKGQLKAAKKADRTTSQGLIEAYIHIGGHIGAMIELNCESDFVARTSEFKELAHNLAMQVAAMCPQYISKEEIPEGDEKEVETACLLLQPYIRDPNRTVQDVIVETITKVGENIKVSRFGRFELGSQVTRK
ncbi:MAG: elongation factor Ts [Dehalococcoidales bacterium]|nr:elongation factor Ts [Dehalococcoidales bacterium]